MTWQRAIPEIELSRLPTSGYYQEHVRVWWQQTGEAGAGWDDQAVVWRRYGVVIGREGELTEPDQEFFYHTGDLDVTLIRFPLIFKMWNGG